MKQLKSSLKDLREIFERSITVREIAEPLASFDVSCSVDEVINFMNNKKYDIIGLRKDGIIAGYTNKSDLLRWNLDKYSNFKQKEKFPETTPLIFVFEAFKSSEIERIFIVVLGRVCGIVTRGDFQKVPIRMWLFGLISLLEMNILRIIRDCYPYNEWCNLINIKRLDKAKEKYDNLHKENAAIDLAECLEFCDKREILIKSKDILKELSVDKKYLQKILNALKS